MPRAPLPAVRMSVVRGSWVESGRQFVWLSRDAQSRFVCTRARAFASSEVPEAGSSGSVPITVRSLPLTVVGLMEWFSRGSLGSGRGRTVGGVHAGPDVDDRAGGIGQSARRRQPEGRACPPYFDGVATARSISSMILKRSASICRSPIGSARPGRPDGHPRSPGSRRRSRDPSTCAGRGHSKRPSTRTGTWRVRKPVPISDSAALT